MLAIFRKRAGKLSAELEELKAKAARYRTAGGGRTAGSRTAPYGSKLER
jgi:hypothetical protein